MERIASLSFFFKQMNVLNFYVFFSIFFFYIFPLEMFDSSIRSL